MPTLIAVYPVAKEDPAALPVKDLESALAFYQRVLGFSLVSRERSEAALVRDAVRIGIVVDATHDPGRAGSLAFEVTDLEAMHRELERVDASPGTFGVDEWNGRSHRTFFLREAENGYCYCFYKPT